MFEAYITNTALYPLMGIEVGTTVHFPMTTQELQAALAKIGIDGKRYSEVFFTSFDSDVLGLYDHLYECENIDELNELGHALLEVRDKGGLETFEAALVLGNHTRSVKDLINQDKAGLQPNEAPACLFFQRSGGGPPGLPVFPWQYREQCRHVPDDRPHAPVLLSGYV